MTFCEFLSWSTFTQTGTRWDSFSFRCQIIYNDVTIRLDTFWCLPPPWQQPGARFSSAQRSEWRLSKRCLLPTLCLFHWLLWTQNHFLEISRPSSITKAFWLNAENRIISVWLPSDNCFPRFNPSQVRTQCKLGKSLEQTRSEGHCTLTQMPAQNFYWTFRRRQRECSIYRHTSEPRRIPLSHPGFYWKGWGHAYMFCNTVGKPWVVYSSSSAAARLGVAIQNTYPQFMLAGRFVDNSPEKLALFWIILHSQA